jgi:hypothetical protein
MADGDFGGMIIPSGVASSETINFAPSGEQAARQAAPQTWGFFNEPRFTLEQYKRGDLAGLNLNRFPVSTTVMPDVSSAVASGKVVDVTPEHFMRGFSVQDKNSVQGLYIHPQTKQWVRFSELPRGQNGMPQAIGQADGNPFMNRSGTVELAHMPERSSWLGWRDNFLKPAAVIGAIATGAALAAPAMAGTGAAGAGAGAAGAGAAGASGAGIGSGLFAGGLEAAAAGAAPVGGFLGGGGGALGFGGMGAAATGAGASTIPALAGGTISGAGMASTGGGLSGLMSWLGSPTGQAVSQLGSAALQGGMAQRAAGQQAGAAQAGIDEQRRQFEAMRAGLAPFQQAGTQALGGFAPYQQAGLQAFGQQQALAGLQGQQAQQQAIGALEASPLYQSLAKQGEEAILQRASATGGLRGGNVQAALAQFRPAMLQQLIDQQYQRLGGFAGTGLDVTGKLASLGQSSAAMQGQGGMNAANSIGNLLAQQGQAQAGGTLGIGQGIGQALNIPQQMAAQDRAGRLFDMMSRMYGAQ